jgi:carbonic anhydrase
VSSRLRTVLRRASAPHDLRRARRLFEQYAAWLGVDLGFQGFAEELATLPGRYAPPGGRLLIALRRRRAVGCIAVRPHADRVCELKRLYVLPEARGNGVGELLARAALRFASARGYRRAVLDTLATMAPALALYRRIGFTECPPYYANPHPDVVYLARDL